MTRKLMHTFVATSVLCTGGLASAQELVDAGEFNLENWSYDRLYEPSSWSVDALMDNAVMGSDGEEIGEVEDLIFNDSGELLALVAEVGGLWDIGDTHVSIPWEDVEASGTGPVTIPLTEENVDDFDVLNYSGLPGTRLGETIVPDVDDETFTGGIWRASDLLGDYVRLQDEDAAWLNFGYVSDLIVKDAEIAATVVHATGFRDRGRYAYPPYPPVRTGSRDTAIGWTPGGITYDVPILVGDATSLPSFDVGRVNELQAN